VPKSFRGRAIKVVARGHGQYAPVQRYYSLMSQSACASLPRLRRSIRPWWGDGYKRGGLHKPGSEPARLLFGGLAGKERPKRATIVLTSLFVSWIGGLGYVLVEHRYKDPISNTLGVFKKT